MKQPPGSLLEAEAGENTSLGWLGLGIPPEELEEVTGKREVIPAYT